MADIFLSYNEKDRDQAGRVADLLTEAGWSVWWDRRIPAGESWRSVLEDALDEMRCMIVLWTARSIESEWVYEEASEGRRQDKLIPVMLEAVRPPAGFREIQAADLTGWDGSADFAGWRLLLTDLEKMLGPPAGARPQAAAGPGEKVPPAPAPSPGQAWPVERLLGWVLAGLLPLAALAYLVGQTPSSPPAPPTSPPPVQPVGMPPLAPEPAKTADRPALADKPLQRPTETTMTTVTPPRPPVAATSRRSSARCADLLSRVQLGESLADTEQAQLQKECRQ